MAINVKTLTDRHTEVTWPFILPAKHNKEVLIILDQSNRKMFYVSGILMNSGTPSTAVLLMIIGIKRQR